MIRRPPRSTQSRSSAASDVYKRQLVEQRTRCLQQLHRRRVPTEQDPGRHDDRRRRRQRPADVRRRCIRDRCEVAAHHDERRLVDCAWATGAHHLLPARGRRPLPGQLRRIRAPGHAGRLTESPRASAYGVYTGLSQEILSVLRHTRLMAGSTAAPEARLVVVDDEPNIRELLTTSLRFAGFEVHSAADGNSAIRTIRDVDPDLVVLAVMLPHLPAFTVTRRLRDAGQHVPVLFLTARDDPQDKISGPRPLPG